MRLEACTSTFKQQKLVGSNLFSIATPNGASRFALVAGADGRAEYVQMGLRSLKHVDK